MALTLEQVTEMAPDGGSAAAGKKLMAAKNWQSLGRNAEALWGLCQGSAIYQVKVDLTNLGFHCSCPSRKFPCKHTLGLLMLCASSPDAAPEAALPEWAQTWLAKRRAREQKTAEQNSDAPATAEAKPVDAKSQQRRAEQRAQRVVQGVAQFDLWLKDLVRTGLAGVESRPPGFWTDQSKRLVDAQAPALAAAVARLAAIPGSGRDWPARLLGECGRLKLLLEAFDRLDQLDLALQHEVRQLIGWTVSQAELDTLGESVADHWVVVGQLLDDEDRVRVQRSWLIGRETKCPALVLQFSAGGQPFPETILPGSEQSASLVFYPGALRLRAKIQQRSRIVDEVAARPPCVPTVEALLALFAEIHARSPWLNSLGYVVQDATLVPGTQQWHLVDRAGQALPVAGQNYWRLLAINGGQPADMAGEWDGQAWRPMAMFLDGQFWAA